MVAHCHKHETCHAAPGVMFLRFAILPDSQIAMCTIQPIGAAAISAESWRSYDGNNQVPHQCLFRLSTALLEEPPSRFQKPRPNQNKHNECQSDTATHASSLDIFQVFPLEPAVGVEPTTYCLRNNCSTTELCWLKFAKRRGLEPHTVCIFSMQACPSLLYCSTASRTSR